MTTTNNEIGASKDGLNEFDEALLRFIASTLRGLVDVAVREARSDYERVRDAVYDAAERIPAPREGDSPFERICRARCKRMLDPIFDAIAEIEEREGRL